MSNNLASGVKAVPFDLANFNSPNACPHPIIKVRCAAERRLCQPKQIAGVDSSSDEKENSVTCSLASRSQKTKNASGRRADGAMLCLCCVIISFEFCDYNIIFRYVFKIEKFVVS